MGAVFTEVVVHCRITKMDLRKPILIFCRVAGPSQTSGILKYIVLKAKYRVKESLGGHLCEGAVTGCDCVRSSVSAMTAQKEKL